GEQRTEWRTGVDAGLTRLLFLYDLRQIKVRNFLRLRLPAQQVRLCQDVLGEPGGQILSPEPLPEGGESYVRVCPRQLWIAGCLRVVRRKIVLILFARPVRFIQAVLVPIIAPTNTDTDVWYSLVVHRQVGRYQVDDQARNFVEN